MLEINLKGKTAFVAGVADDIGFGWAIAKALYMAGARVAIGTWVPMMGIFEQSWKAGKFDQSRRLDDGSMLEFEGVFPMDAAYDEASDIPDEVRQSRRYSEFSRYSLSEVAQSVYEKMGPIDIVIHSLANAPEIKNDLLNTSRKGYLAAISASSYSFISLVKQFGPMMQQGGLALTLSYLAGQRAFPGYGGGMSSAKAALENDMRLLAWEAGRQWKIRVNAISAGPMQTRAAKAIGIIDKMVSYSCNNSPLPYEIEGSDIANLAAFLSSDRARCITGSLLFVDNGMHAMGVAPQLTTHPLPESN